MKSFLKICLGILLTISLFGCSASSKPTNSSEINNNEDNSLAKIRERGELIIGTSADFAPREFHMVIDGKDTIVGYDIDVANEIAKDIGVKLKVEDISFDGLLPALNAGHIDMVIAGMVITPERLKAVDFSIHYGKSDDVKEGHKILIRKEDKDTFTTIESLTNKKLGVQKSSIQEQMANNQVSNAKIISLTKVPNMVLDLNSKKVDAIILSSDVAKNYANKDEKLYVTDIPLTQDTEEVGIAFKKGSNELVQQTNSTLQRLMDTGLMDEIIEKNEKIVQELNN